MSFSVKEIDENLLPYEPKARGTVFISALLHVAVILVAIFGLPHIKRDLPKIDHSITVELVSSTAAPEKETQSKLAPPKQIKEKPPRPAMPKVTSKTPPKPVAPKPPEKKEFIKPEVKETKPAEVEKKPEKKPDPKPEPPEETQEEPFKGLLKNLMDEEPVSETPEEKEDVGEEPRQFSQDEINALIRSIDQQLTNCWKLLYGARYAEDLVVRLKLFMNPDGSVRDAQIVDQLRYNTDSFYRAAADAALRAVFNPQCNPMDLPYDQYELWDVINAEFDPSQML